MQGKCVTKNLDWLPLGPGVMVLNHHPCGLLALAKPSGVMSHPNSRSKEEIERSLLASRYEVKGEFYQVGDRRVYLLHRLDSATSGVILLAENEVLTEELKARFAGREIEKVYLARVFGTPFSKEDLWQDRMTVKKIGGKLRGMVGPVGERAVCEMRLLAKGEGRPVTSLLELRPHTGRTHQLRVQCQSRRVPIVGDQTYGDFARNRSFAKETGLDRLMLHALQVTVPIQWKGQKHKFTARAEPPEGFSF